ncbi:MAG: hypothetical protein AB7E42_08210 [Anaerotignaceae bacterium]
MLLGKIIADKVDISINNGCIIIEIRITRNTLTGLSFFIENVSVIEAFEVKKYAAIGTAYIINETKIVIVKPDNGS